MILTNGKTCLISDENVYLYQAGLPNVMPKANSLASAESFPGAVAQHMRVAGLPSC